MVLLHLSLRLFLDLLHLHLLFHTDAHHSSDGISHILVVLDAVFLEDTDDFRAGEHKLYLFHEEETKGVLVGLDILDEFDVEAHHGIQQLLGHVVRMEEFFQLKQLLDLLIPESDVNTAPVLHLLFLTIKSYRLYQ